MRVHFITLKNNLNFVYTNMQGESIIKKTLIVNNI